MWIISLVIVLALNSIITKHLLTIADYRLSLYERGRLEGTVNALNPRIGRLE